MGQSLPLFVREPAEFLPEGDHIICRWCGTEWIMSFATAQAVSSRLNRALDAWHADDGATIIKFPE